MKIYLDGNNKLIGYETVFYDKREKRPKTNLDHGFKNTELFLTEKQNNFLRDHLDKGGKITQLTLQKDGTFIVNKSIEQNQQGNCVDCPKTVIVNINDFKPDSDLMRHFKDKNIYTFKELDKIPFDLVDTKYLYYFDKSILDFELNGNHIINKSLKRFFGLFDKENKLTAFIYLIKKEIPIIMVLYHNEIYNNAGYIILYRLIELFKKEKQKYLDLGGLTKKESGINQFKQKFGRTILIKDLIYFNSG